MTPTEAVKLTRLVKAICPQQAFDEYTADAWSELLADLNIADATRAVKQLGQRQVFIAPAEIRAEVRRIRSERIDKAPPITPPPELTPAETINWLRRTRRAIADGTYAPPELELKPRDMTAIEATFKSLEDA